MLRMERILKEVTMEQELSEEKYENLQQKYLDERRQWETEMAYIQDKYQKDIEYYQSKVDKQKDKVKEVMKEMERMKGKLV